MTKEVTTTTVKVAKMEMVDGLPQAVTLPDEVLLGNVSVEKAQKLVSKIYETPVTVFEVNAETQVYEMSVEDFIKVASLKVETEVTEENQN